MSPDILFELLQILEAEGRMLVSEDQLLDRRSQELVSEGRRDAVEDPMTKCILRHTVAEITTQLKTRYHIPEWILKITERFPILLQQRNAHQELIVDQIDFTYAQHLMQRRFNVKDTLSLLSARPGIFKRDSGYLILIHLIEQNSIELVQGLIQHPEALHFAPLYHPEVRALHRAIEYCPNMIPVLLRADAARGNLMSTGSELNFEISNREHKLTRIVDSSGRIALHLAIESKNITIARQLIAHDPESVLCLDSNQGSPLAIAVSYRNLALVQLLVEAELQLPRRSTMMGWIGDGTSPLAYAARHGSHAILTYMVKAYDFPVELVDEVGLSLLHMACDGRVSTETVKFLLTRSLSIVSLISGNLVDARSLSSSPHFLEYIDRPSYLGTPLQIAIRDGSLSKAVLLLQMGSQVPDDIEIGTIRNSELRRLILACSNFPMDPEERRELRFLVYFQSSLVEQLLIWS